jgi:hypothetical protein
MPRWLLRVGEAVGELGWWENKFIFLGAGSTIGSTKYSGPKNIFLVVG